MKRTLIIPLALFSASCIFSAGADDPPPPNNSSAQNNENAGTGRDCEDYCTIMESLCPDTTFPGEEFDREKCITQCGFFPNRPIPGKELGDRVEDRDSLQCRYYHAKNGERLGTIDNEHCTHARPDTTKCIEQEPCPSYCADFDELCGDTDFAPDSPEACYEACAALRQGDRGDILPGDTRECRYDFVKSGNRDNCEAASFGSRACVDLGG